MYHKNKNERTQGAGAYSVPRERLLILVAVLYIQSPDQHKYSKD